MKKQHLVKAALELFVEKGVKGTTTREIAQRAGTAEGTLYRHFNGKEDLALELFIDCMDRFASWLAEAAAAGSDPAERVRRFVQAFFAFASEDPISYGYIMLTHTSASRQVPPERVKPKDILVELIEEGIREGRFQARDANLSAALVIGMCIRSIFFWRQGTIDLSYDATVDEVARAVSQVLI